MASDALLILQTQVTATVNQTSNWVELKTGTPRRGMYAQLLVSAYTAANGAPTFTHKIQVSEDQTAIYDRVTYNPLTGTTATQTYEAWESLDTGARYARVVMTMSATTGTPSVAYQVNFNTGEYKTHPAP